ncbi:MAG: hypothetical protein CYPHOPRED_000673 [Cyphobasidiales sp. Tagirdzhanova-0007]|nr:MAG: hypothetical protein CYPHOPRED_000673 [Cyphobasidiales sp. Tagirdzhanova-0007]
MDFLFPEVKMLKLEKGNDGSLMYFGGAFKTWDQSWDKDHYTSRQLFDHKSQFTNSRKAIATPPYHWHIYQIETFEVKSGIMHYCLDGKEGILKPGEKVVIQPGIPHTFWCDGNDGIDLEVLITVRGGPNPGFDGSFVRQFYGFLHSNALQGRTPNLFHALAYMYDADVIIQDFPVNSGKLANYIGATFPVPIGEWNSKGLDLDISSGKLSDGQRKKLLRNIEVMRDSIILFTATGAARGVSGHTGGPFDTVPEVCILEAFFAGEKTKDHFVPIMFDEAGHRVATQYFLAAAHGDLPHEHLLYYRAANSKLPGHPELGLTPGVKFSSGRLGHMWPLVNGVAMANRDKVIVCLGSDGSFQEGDDAEAARLAVAQNLNIKASNSLNFLKIVNNQLAGHPSEYLKGYNMKQTLEGHGMKVFSCDGENIDELYSCICEAVSTPGPIAVVAKRKMAPGVEGIEGSPHGHDVIPVDKAIKYLTKRGYNEKGYVTKIFDNIRPAPNPYLYIGSSRDVGANRVVFGEAVNEVLDKHLERKKDVMVIDSDLEGSTGLKAIHQKHPECFVPSGIMERGNLSAAAGFGFDRTKFGVFSTFSAFLEMVISELTMARLNHCNLLCHFSHSGVDEMADNTCHFGISGMYADNGLADTNSYLYFPADPAQMRKVVSQVFFEHGIRFIFSTRAKVPWILKENSQERFFDSDDYKFVPGKDEIIRGADDPKAITGWVVTFGEMLYRVVDAVDRLNETEKGLVRIGVINKVSVNLVSACGYVAPATLKRDQQIDEESLNLIGNSKFVLVAESWNEKTGLGSRMGTQLLERNYAPKFKRMGATREGCGGLSEQIPFQGLDSQSVLVELQKLIT